MGAECSRDQDGTCKLFPKIWSKAGHTTPLGFRFSGTDQHKSQSHCTAREPAAVRFTTNDEELICRWLLPCIVISPEQGLRPAEPKICPQRLAAQFADLGVDPSLSAEGTQGPGVDTSLRALSAAWADAFAVEHAEGVSWRVRAPTAEGQRLKLLILDRLDSAEVITAFLNKRRDPCNLAVRAAHRVGDAPACCDEVGRELVGLGCITNGAACETDGWVWLGDWCEDMAWGPAGKRFANAWAGEWSRDDRGLETPLQRTKIFRVRIKQRATSAHGSTVRNRAPSVRDRAASLRGSNIRDRASNVCDRAASVAPVEDLIFSSGSPIRASSELGAGSGGGFNTATPTRNIRGFTILRTYTNL